MNINTELKEIEEKQKKIASNVKQITIQISILIIYLVILIASNPQSKFWVIGAIAMGVWIYRCIIKAEKELKSMVEHIDEVQKTSNFKKKPT